MKSDFRDLIVWQKAMDMVVSVYQATRQFPKDELFGLASQMRRSAVSVPSNIAEGQGRPTRALFSNFLGNAKGSLAELETQALIAQRLGYLAADSSLLSQISEVARLLNGLINSLKNRQLTTDN
jgi:four helix bundle protein